MHWFWYLSYLSKIKMRNLDHELLSDLENDYDPYNTDDLMFLRLNRIFILGKDNITKWLKNRLANNTISDKMNSQYSSQLSCINPIVKHAVSNIDFWKLFFSDSVINEMVVYTKKYLEKIRKNYHTRYLLTNTKSTRVLIFYILMNFSVLTI